jgi:hypothetical protein
MSDGLATQSCQQNDNFISTRHWVDVTHLAARRRQMNAVVFSASWRAFSLRLEPPHHRSMAEAPPIHPHLPPTGLRTPTIEYTSPARLEPHHQLSFNSL